MEQNGKQLIRNKIECLACHDVIESKHRHDFQECQCGSVFVDGGKSYQRWGWPDKGRLEEWIADRSEWEPIETLPLLGLENSDGT